MAELGRLRVPVGPYSSHVSRTLRWSWGGGAVSYERGTPLAFTRQSRLMRRKRRGRSTRWWMVPELWRLTSAGVVAVDLETLN